VSTYFTANYAADTLLHAFVTHDSTYVLISKNNGLYSTAITPAGSLVKRMQIDNHRGKVASVTEAALPAAATAYLSTTYAGYVFNKAFSVSKAGVIQSYVVFITVNNTRYAVAFNASGTFVAAKAIR
jgi:6-phosphogluconolactonase (cycloisomerase 2 family)